jgi:hypothetical protein
MAGARLLWRAFAKFWPTDKDSVVHGPAMNIDHLQPGSQDISHLPLLHRFLHALFASCFTLACFL